MNHSNIIIIKLALLHIAKNAISKLILLVFNIMTAKKKTPNWKKIEREYISGIKPAELCKKYNLNKNTFDTQRRQGKWTEKKRKYNENITKKSENIEADLITAEKREFHETAKKLREQLKNKIENSNNSIDISNHTRSLKNLQEIIWKSLDVPDKNDINITGGLKVEFVNYTKDEKDP